MRSWRRPHEDLVLSGALIFASYWLDSMDGFSARKLNAQSEFGLQLDSLVDVVSLGVAPAVLVFQHMLLGGINISWAAPLVIFLALAGAFRLARFNQLPPKTTSSHDSDWADDHPVGRHPGAGCAGGQRIRG